MSRIEKGFYPLSEIEQREVPKIALDLNLPEYVDKDQIGINLKGIYQMCRIGGIRTLYVAGQSGETSSYTPTMVGHTPDGAGMAGKAGIQKKAPTHSVDERGDNGSGIFAGRWIDAEVSLNLSEMSDKLSAAGQLRSSKAWAEEINPVLKQGILEAGHVHLIWGSSMLDKLGAGVATINGVSDGETNYWAESLTPVGNSLVGLTVWNGLFNIADRVRYQFSEQEDGFRWSVFTGPQLDRALVLRGMAKTKKLVKELPKEPKA